jgi:phage baseplate assembly protein W
MAINVNKIHTDDLFVDRAIGISLPFNSSNVFTSIYNTKEQLRYNVINFMLTNKGERIFKPEFGADIRRYLFEPDTNIKILEKTLPDEIQNQIPQIRVDNIFIDRAEEHLININVKYTILLSQETDSFNINLK